MFDSGPWLHGITTLNAPVPRTRHRLHRLCVRLDRVRHAGTRGRLYYRSHGNPDVHEAMKSVSTGQMLGAGAGASSARAPLRLHSRAGGPERADGAARGALICLSCAELSFLACNFLIALVGHTRRTRLRRSCERRRCARRRNEYAATGRRLRWHLNTRHSHVLCCCSVPAMMDDMRV